MIIVYLIEIVLAIVVLLFAICVIRTALLPSKTTYYEESKDSKRINEYAKKLLVKIDEDNIINKLISKK